jgi:hypothetical protein
MLFFMGSASHFLSLYPAPGVSVAPYWIVALAIILACEIHVLIGNRGLATQKMLTAPAPRGMIHAGFALAVLLYLNAAFLL